MTVRVRLLGPPQFRQGAEWRDAPLDKRLALLTYLACAGEWISREHLAFLFWPDTSTSSARINLRQLLARTKALALEVPVEADDKRIRWLVACDVKQLRQAVAKADWCSALNLYQGELVAGLELDDAGEFASWLEFERAQLREAHRHAALQGAEASRLAGRPEEAAACYEKLLTEDPLDESVMQLLLKLLVGLGAVDEANRRLQAFSQRLRSELDFAPAAETQLIVDDTPLRRQAAGEPVVRGAADVRSRRSRLAVPLTSFVGREEELATVIDRLASDSCRLLTLLGPGGVGKTRLALRAAQVLEPRFAHGFVAAPLDQVENAEALPYAVAAALEMELRWQRSPLEQLVEFLEDRSLLLVLDSFEHLTDGAHQILRLLSDCPKLKVLVTSRQRLRLQGEWLLPVAGLALPPATTPAATPATPATSTATANGPFVTPVQEALAYDALTLLTERARQVQPGFQLSSSTLPAAIEVCRMLDGLPLGIELAAAWLRSHSIDEVRTAVETSLGELQSDATDTLERHRTLRAVIDHSWHLLNDAQKSGFRSLAVFADGFGSAAARGVASVSLRLLGALCDRSLLVRDKSGRFGAHLLLRRYMEERLSEQPSEVVRLREAHADHYLRVLSSWRTRLHGPEQPDMLEALTPDYGNICSAWLNALDWGWAAKCLLAMEPLVLFHGVQGRFREGEELFGAGLERFGARAASVENGTELLAYLEVNHAWFLAGLARFEEAADRANAALARVVSTGPAQVELRALNVLGSIASRRGDGAAALELLERGLSVSEALGDQWGTGLIAGQLGLLALRSDDPGAARPHFERALAINEALGNTPGIVNDLDYLGRLSLASGDQAGAAAAFERGLEMAEGSHFRLRLPYLKTQLAAVKLALGQSSAAAALAQEALTVAEELGQRALQAEALTLVGRAVAGEPEKYDCFRRALTLLSALSDGPRTLEVIVYLAQLPMHRAHAPTLLRLVMQHPATRPAQREQARQLLSALGTKSAAQGSLPSLEEAVRLFLA